MSVKVKYSNTYHAKRKRIVRIPKFLHPVMMAMAKRDAVRMITEFKSGIKSNSFGLERLEDETIQRKRLLGYTLPRVPLYGEGDENKDRSYVNMLRIRNIKRGWKVYPSWAKHHSSDLKLRDLLTVHEFGTIIPTDKGFIRIPPRPAYLRAYKRVLKARKAPEAAAEVKRAINKHINDADTSYYQRVQNRLLEGLARAGVIEE